MPPIAQEPLAVRAQVTEAPDKAQLKNMISALEQMLVSVPESLDTLPPELQNSIQGSYVQDWRTLTASIRHGADGVRPPLLLALCTLSLCIFMDSASAASLAGRCGTGG